MSKKCEINEKIAVNCNGEIRYLIYLGDSGKRIGNGEVVGIWKCHCGNDFECKNYSIVNGQTKSCRCWAKEISKLKLKNPKLTYLKKLHVHTKQKCYNENDDNYKYYGALGIKIQEDWLNDSEKFINDLLEKIGHRPTEKHSLDRINVKGNYTIDNIRWATYKEQARNKRNNILITINNETKTIAEWTEIYNLSPGVISKRLKRGCVNNELIAPVKSKILSQNITKKTYYNLWIRTRDKTTNPNHEDYYLYGEKNIIFYKLWFDNFDLFMQELLKEIGPKPSLNYSLDRINNNGNYEPGNIRWATNKEQARNKSNNKLITINGQIKTLAEWSEISGLDRRIICWRINKNWPEDQLLTPIQKNKFTSNQIEEIIQKRNSGITIKNLSIEYNTTNKTIRDIIYQRGGYTK